MRKTSLTDLAEVYLRQKLEHGPVLSSVIFKENDDPEGFGRATLYRAADRLGVVSSPGPTHRSRLWELPKPKPMVFETAAAAIARLGWRPNADL